MTDKPRFVGERVKLGDLISPFTKRNKDALCTDVYSVTNSRGFTPSEDYFSKEVFSKDLKTYRIVKQGMIAYNPSRINVGSIAIQDKLPEVVVSPLYIVFETDKSRLLPEYALGFLRSKPGLDQIAFQSIGTVRNNLKFDALCRITINLPSLDRQRACIDQLDRIASIIELLNRYISELDALVKSRFIEMFGGALSIENKWDSSILENCVESLESGKSPSCKNTSRKGSDPGVLKLSALSSGRFLSGENKAMLDGETIIQAKEVKQGDILLARKNTPQLVGSCVLVRENVKKLMFPDIVFRMHPNDSVNGEYLAALLSGPSYSNKVRGLAHGSNKSMSNIPKSELARLSIPLPPLSLQQQFAAFVASVDKSRFIAQQQIEKLQMLYDSLAQEYFA